MFMSTFLVIFVVALSVESLSTTIFLFVVLVFTGASVFYVQRLLRKIAELRKNLNETYLKLLEEL